MKNTTNNAVTITGSGKIAAVVNGTPYSVGTDHPNYLPIIETIKSGDWDGFVSLVDIAASVAVYANTQGFEIKDGCVLFNGEEIHNTLTKRIVKFMGEGLPFDPLLKFLKNLMDNPSKRAVDELYDFLDMGELPITEDGHFLAYKNVRGDYMDIYSGTKSNKVGDKPEMPRNKVDEDKNRTCSQGLHFCSISYLPHFSDSDGGHTMILKINPANVVAIPADYKNAKGRACTYEVIAEYKEDWRGKLAQGESGFDSDLYADNGDDYDEDEDGNYDFYGVKPSGQKFYNLRGEDGKFKKNVGVVDTDSISKDKVDLISKILTSLGLKQI